MRLAFDLEQIGVWSFDFTTSQVQWDNRSGAFFSLPAYRPLSSKEVLSRIHPEDRMVFENNSPPCVRRVDALKRQAGILNIEFIFDCSVKAIAQQKKTGVK
jgi:hypothetical protein